MREMICAQIVWPLCGLLVLVTATALISAALSGSLVSGLVVVGVALLVAAAIAGGVALGLWGDRLWQARKRARE